MAVSREFRLCARVLHSLQHRMVSGQTSQGEFFSLEVLYFPAHAGGIGTEHSSLRVEDIQAE